MKEREGTSGELELLSIQDMTDSIERSIERVEKSVELYKRIRIVSLKLTKETDWIINRSSKGESLYLQEKGSESIGNAWGIDVTGLRLYIEWQEDDKGKYYVWNAEGKAYSRKLGRYIEDVGTCSQRDKFFGKIGDSWKEIEDVDITNIKRKAVTNLYNRIIKRMVGLSSITREDVELAGLVYDKIPVISYEEDKKKKEAQMTPEAKDERSMIDRIAGILSLGDSDEKKNFVKNASHFVKQEKDEKTGKILKEREFYVDDASKLTSDRWIHTTYERIKEVLKTSFPEEYEKLFPGDKKNAQASPEKKK
jgi:hypothetical protein